MVIGKYRITGYQENDEIKIRRLFQHAYGRDLSLSAWRWQFQNNPFRKEWMISVWSGDLLVAYTGITAFYGFLDGKEVMVAFSGHTMAHRDYPGISRLMLTRMREETGCIKLFYAFPNHNSFRIFRDVLHYTCPGEVRFLISRPRLEGSTDQNVRRFLHFTEEHGTLYEKLIQNHQYIAKRDLAFLKWRIEEKPESGYCLFEFREDARLKGYMVLNQYQEEGILSGQVIDIIAPETYALKKLLQFAQIYFGKTGCARVKIWMTSQYYRTIVEEMGFSPAGRRFPLIMSREGYRLSDMYLTMVDSDVF